MIKLNIQYVWKERNVTYIVISLPNSKKYYLPTVECITPFCISWEGNDYYVNAHALTEYEKVCNIHY